MFLYLLTATTDRGVTFTEIITPYLPLIGVLAGALVVGAFGLWNRRRGALETRAPDVNESWMRADAADRALDTERAVRRLMEDLLYRVLVAFRGYVNRVQGGGSTELTEKERTSYEARIPSERDLNK